MPYKVLLKSSAAKFLDRISQKDYKIISFHIANLVNEPRPLNSKKILSNKNNIYRIRIGRFRIIYVIDDNNKTVNILEVKLRREDTYRGF